MLDNLDGADLSGIGGYIDYRYDSADAISAQGIQSAIALVTILVLIAVATSFFSPSRTKRYRRLMVAMYVAAKVRDMAKKDGLDLDSEYKNFQRWDKKQKSLSDEKDLDDVIEDETSEKVIDSGEKEREKK